MRRGPRTDLPDGLVEVELVEGPEPHERLGSGPPSTPSAGHPVPRGGHPPAPVMVHEQAAHGRASGAPAEPGSPASEPDGGAAVTAKRPPPESEPDGDRRRPGTRRWFARPAVVVTLVVVAVVVASNAAEILRERSERAALAEVAGILDPMPEPLTVVWEVEGALMGGTSEVALVERAGTTSAVDPATGAVLWTRTADSAGQEYCRPIGVAGLELWAMYSGEPVEPSDDPRLLGCAPWTMAAYDGVVADAEEVRMVILDAGTGEVRHTLTAPGPALMTEPVGLDVVFVVADPQGRVRVIRWDPVTGEKLSDETSSFAVFEPGEPLPLRWEQSEEHLLVAGVRTVAFSLVTGKQTDPEDIGDSLGWDQTVTLPDGAEATWTHRNDGTGDGTVTEPDGTVRFELPEPPWRPSTADGSVPQVILVASRSGARVQGLDATTGEEIWSANLGGGQPLVQIDGVVVIHRESEVVAIDVRDGEQLWSAPASSPGWFDGLTDGEVIVAVELGDRARMELVARTIEDGTERWRTTLPDGFGWLQKWPGGHIVGTDGDGIFGLG